jgi:hypothetical protein
MGFSASGGVWDGILRRVDVMECDGARVEVLLFTAVYQANR